MIGLSGAPARVVRRGWHREGIPNAAHDIGGHLHANHGDRLVYRAMILKRAGRLDEARHDCSEVDSMLYKSDAEICVGL
jgi:hypothetical protein